MRLIATTLSIALLLTAALLAALSASAPSGDAQIPGRTLFVTAHPDDEVMFFGPSLLRSADAHVLCLSRGAPNGTVRTAELSAACAALGLRGRCSVSRDPLEDGFSAYWDPARVLSAVSDAAASLRADRIVTFDSRGVSGHPNHVAIPRALRRSSLPPVYVLRSGPSVLKYAGRAAAAAYSLLWRPRGGFFLTTPAPAARNRTLPRAFLQHFSQVVWYRRLWLAHSRFMHFNHLVPAELEK